MIQINPERKWCKGMSPQQLHEKTGCYDGWMKEMDRCWISDDGVCVLSRLLRTDWGKIEHATIINNNNGLEAFMSFQGERDIPWAVKQEIKNQVFGENRLAVEIFPADNRLVDSCDVYHLWIFDKNFSLPFGIHPKDRKATTIRRGYSFTTEDAEAYRCFIGNETIMTRKLADMEL